jgi:hypothetical protein
MNITDLLANVKNGFTGFTAHVDLQTLLQVAAAAEAALPAIESGVVSATPYVLAFIKVLSGQQPTADDWAALDARLDAGSDALQQAANQPDPNAGSAT